jgi:hypothetical protein
VAFRDFLATAKMLSGGGADVVVSEKAMSDIVWPSSESQNAALTMSTISTTSLNSR